MRAASDQRGLKALCDRDANPGFALALDSALSLHLAMPELDEATPSLTALATPSGAAPATSADAVRVLVLEGEGGQARVGCPGPFEIRTFRDDQSFPIPSLLAERAAAAGWRRFLMQDDRLWILLDPTDLFERAEAISAAARDAESP